MRRLMVVCCCAMLFGSPCSHAQVVSSEDPTEVLPAENWREIDQSVTDALDWLILQQQRDGSFPTMDTGQPAVTSLVVLAFMAHGHLPGQGKYGENLENAIDFILKCQKRSGLVAKVGPVGATLSRNISHDIGYTASYNHAISGLALSEAYAIEGQTRSQKIEQAIARALQVTFTMQNWPKDDPDDEGGWRYLDDYRDIDDEGRNKDSDLSVTGWQLMFLRSAKNAGFDVPQEPIDRAIGYVRRCFREETGAFTYKLVRRNRVSRGMAGAGVLALAHAGLHNTAEARSAGEWILQSGFDRYNSSGRLTGSRRNDDRYHYGLLTCCQAMYQLGGHYWADFFPDTARVVVRAQNSDGSWDREDHRTDRRFGNTYTTAICVLALGSPNQLLPVFQR